MAKQQSRYSKEHGFTLVYMAAMMSGMVLFTGLAVDSGRAYMVKAQLTKAVDGAALAAARNLNSGDPAAEARRIFRANFPDGYLGTLSGDPTLDPGFFRSSVDEANGVNIVTVNASVMLPTTFMRLASINDVEVASMGEATRRMVDLSLVLDVSSSIGPAWGAVRDATRTFIQSFDASSDRMALTTFGNGARVLRQMPSTRGFDKTAMVNAVPNALPGGSTNMVEGLYRGWDELRTVPAGTQSGLRIVVLFTDGASNSVPALWDGATSKGLRTFDFPQSAGDTNGQTWNQPHVTGLYDAETGAQTNAIDQIFNWNDRSIPPATLPAFARWLPATSTHTHHRSAGIPTTFPLQTNQLMVDGVPQSTARGLRDLTAGRYPSQVWNINNAARNLVEIIANEARNDDGDYPIRIYTIGMGQLVRLNLGTRLETPESILQRISNDIESEDFDEDQLEGKYFYAATAADVGPAFQGIQNQILRLSK